MSENLAKIYKTNGTSYHYPRLLKLCFQKILKYHSFLLITVSLINALYSIKDLEYYFKDNYKVLYSLFLYNIQSCGNLVQNGCSHQLVIFGIVYYLRDCFFL